jgi:hypothetical protein
MPAPIHSKPMRAMKAGLDGRRPIWVGGGGSPGLPGLPDREGRPRRDPLRPACAPREVPRPVTRPVPRGDRRPDLATSPTVPDRS